MRLATVLLLALVVSGFASTASADLRWEVVESRPDGLRLRLETEGARVLPVGTVNGQAYVRIELRGAGGVAEPGHAELPLAARWVILPPEGAARVRVISIQTEALGMGRVLPAPIAGLDPDDGGDRPRLRESTREADDYMEHGVDRSEVVELGAAVFQKRQRMAPLRVRPVLHDPRSGEIQVVRSMEVELAWPRGAEVADAVPSVDRALAGAVLNPEFAASWSVLSPHLREREQARRATPAIDFSKRRAEIFDADQLVADEIRIRSAVTGVVRLRVGDFVEDHALPADTPRKFLRIVRKREGDPLDPSYPAPRFREVPFTFLGSPDESAAVQVTDEILFYAHNAEDDWLEAGEVDPEFPNALPWRSDNFNSTNVYFLQAADPGVGSWARMESASPAGFAGAPSRDFYRRVERFTGDSGYQDDPLNPQVERYHWNTPTERDVARRIEFVHPRPGQAATVRWRAGGHNDTPAFDIAFYLMRDGLRRDLATGQRLSDSGVLAPFAAGLTATGDETWLRDGPVEFHMKRESTDGVERTVQSFLGDVVLEYDALYIASSDVAEFDTGEVGGSVDVEVTGFERADLLAFDITDDRAPRSVVLGAENIVDVGDGTFAVRMRVDQGFDEQRRFYIGPRVAIDRLRGEQLESDPVRNLFAGLDDVQVLAIGPEAFRNAMQPWIDWRSSHVGGNDWNFAYVDVQQVYDEFSGGLQSPWGIKALAEYAYLEWGAKALLLVGDACEDARAITDEAGPNLVPPSLHLQGFLSSRELLASDKWYGTFGVGEDYPQGLLQAADLMVGRLAVTTTQQIDNYVTKLIAYEQPSDEEWRRRTLWITDDAYSTDYIGTGGDCYRYDSNEDRFRWSQELSSDLVLDAFDGVMGSLVDPLDDFTSGCRTGEGPCYNLSQVRQCYAQTWLTHYREQMEQGWLWVSYQGHANFNVLAHENAFLGGQVDVFAPTGRPFVFFGMGCHISDFLQADEGRLGPSIGESLVNVPGGGAIATYGSSGFEFLLQNARFMETITEGFFTTSRTTSPIIGEDLGSQWVLADALASAELVALGLRLSRGDEMVAQYNLLGDPMLRLDAASPRLTLTREGSALTSGMQIDADAGQSTAALDLGATDESGIDRVEISDSEGRDYSSLVGGLDNADPRVVSGSFALPVLPQSYTVEVAVFDKAYPDLRRALVELSVELGAELRVDGEPVDLDQPLSIPVDAPVGVRVDLVAPVDIAASDIAIDFTGVSVTGFAASGAGREWTLSFDAQAEFGEVTGDLVVAIAGYETVLTSSEETPSDALAIVEHVPFPNPMRDEVKILARTEGPVERVRFRVYDLSGRSVFDSDRAPDGRDGGDVFFAWDGRDREGDELANGTYLYRIEVSGPSGSSRSDMGRIVIMR